MAFGLSCSGCGCQMNESLIQHKNSVENNVPIVSINRNFLVCIIDNELLYAACTTENALVAITTSLDGVSMHGSIQRFFSYDGVDWRTVSSLSIVSGKIFAVSTLGIEMIDLENAVHSIRVVCIHFKSEKEAVTSSSAIQQTPRYQSISSGQLPVRRCCWKQ